ncbi:phosphatase PAP2 family protein [Archangium violaceum]|uniref:phosphatase PAP2 family protein n=1 Tax=Archangium violaceum TaxID=83451 RepID=UPI00193B7B5E|nr:phosphatase PAP2 family protein [Archangium violaceum]QRK06490.1 phosphatase PAP2 family protein [Archangium violaceum]
MNPWTSYNQARARARDVHLRGVDIVIVVACSLAALALVGPARWAPGSTRSAVHFAIFALGPLVLRTLESYFPRHRLLAFVASFWLLPVLSLSHGLLNPMVTAVTPGLRDAQLATMDQRLFGFQASVLLGHVVPPWLTDILMICYYGHFVWPLALGLVMYFTGRRDAFHEYLLALSLFFTFNYVCYALVPAIGPRYFLFSEFSQPLQGVWVTPFLDSVMRMPPFARDCFPSGHTGTTLVVFVYAFRFVPRFFRVMLVPGLGLILATLVGRFHYATDLICAVPLVMVVVGLALGWSRATARREAVARPMRMDAIVRP